MRSHEQSPAELPSVNDVRPREEGGPLARVGFSYQDEVAVAFCIEMLNDPSLLKIHCETHDDILLFRVADDGPNAEFVQVIPRPITSQEPR